MIEDKDLRGRGAKSNPANRFEPLQTVWDPSDLPEDPEEEKSLLRTEFYSDSSRSVVTKNDSPDVGFQFSVNPYRGCEHGCAYCYARPSHEYLGFSAGVDFESKIFVKEKAPELLREKLGSKSWTPATIAMSGITDCYQPIERKLKLTRGCLEVLLDFRNPVSIITKNQLITRDIDLLKELANFQAAHVTISVTSLDQKLASDLEPRTSRPAARLEAIRSLSAAGVPVAVNVAPVIPGLNDHEVPAILEAAKKAGALSAGYTPVRLPGNVLPVFTEWLETHRPLRKEKVLSLIREMRGGKLNDPRFGSRMHGEGPIARQMEQMFKLYRQKYGLTQKVELSTRHFRRVQGNQLELF